MQWWIRPGPSRCWASAKPEPSPTDQVPHRHPHVAVHDLGVVPEAPERRVRILHGRHVPHDVDPGCVRRHDDHRRPLVGMDVRVGHRHHDQEVRHRPVGGEPLVPVDHPLVAVPHRRRRQQRRIRSGRVGLGHGERRPQLPVQQRLQPPLALRLVTRGLDAHRQQLRVPRIGRVVAEHHRRQRRLAQDLVHQAQPHLPEPHAAQRRRQVRRPQPLGLDLLLQRPHGHPHLVVGEIQGLEREHLLAHEAAHPLQLLLELGLGREIPGHGHSSQRSGQLPEVHTLPLPWAP